MLTSILQIRSLNNSNRKHKIPTEISVGILNFIYFFYSHGNVVSDMILSTSSFVHRVKGRLTPTFDESHRKTLYFARESITLRIDVSSSETSDISPSSLIPWLEKKSISAETERRNSSAIGPTKALFFALNAPPVQYIFALQLPSSLKILRLLVNILRLRRFSIYFIILRAVDEASRIIVASSPIISAAFLAICSFAEAFSLSRSESGTISFTLLASITPP